MSFVWPNLLWFLILVPLLIAVYILILRRRRKYAVRYSSLSLIREALPKRSKLRQHLPFILFLMGIAFLLTAAARPQASVQVPLSRTTIMLAIDVSRSMCATDVSPNRLSVAQEAALAFVDKQADETRIGIVAFAGFAEVVVPPTNDKEVLRTAIENFTTSIGTAIGSATLKSLDAISEVNTAVAPSGVDLSSVIEGTESEIGFFQPDIIVVLTDGANSQGPLPLEAAQQAADRQVRIYTIGFGSTQPQQMVCSPQQIGSDAFGNGFGGFSRFNDFPDGGGRVPRYLIIDEVTLQGMADLTGGNYYRAKDAEQLYNVFVNLPNEIVLQKEYVEISVVFALLAAFLTGAAVFLSLRWHRVP